MSLSMISAADLKASERLCAKVDSAGKCALAAAATVGNQLVGLIVDGGAASGDPVTVATVGEVAWAKASTGITAGAWVTATTSGLVVTTVTNKNELIGRALTTAGATSDLIKVMVTLGTLSS